MLHLPCKQATCDFITIYYSRQMRIYAKYIIRNLAGPVFFITISLACVVWLTQALRFIDLIVNQGLPIEDFLTLTGLLMPSLVGMVLPIALLCATIYTYNRLSNESELLVLKAAGISRIGAAKPALILAFIVMCFGYGISLYILPVSYSKFRDMQYYFRDNYASLMLEEGIFNTPLPGLAVYVREKTPNGKLKGILVHENSNPKKPITYMAESGWLEKSDTGMSFIMKKGSSQQINRDTGEVNILYFDSYPLDISFYTKSDGERTRKADEMFVTELLNPPPDLQEKERNYYLASGYDRILWPVYNFALPLFVLSILLTGDLNRRGQSKRIIFCVVVSVALIIISVMAKNMVRSGKDFAIIFMYLPVTFTIIYSFIRLGRIKRVKL